jgi:anaerobic magnesium-protoporphyrin IX monomethyl ester cyclase
MKVGLIYPESTFLIEPKVMPPLGLFSLEAMLEKDHDVSFHDLNDGLNEVESCSVFLVTGTSAQAASMREFVQAATGYPYIVLVAGGPHATVDPRGCVDMGFDYVIRGEGELAVAALLHTLEMLPPSKWPERGTVFKPLGRVKDLDRLPWPSRRHAEQYTYTLDGHRATTVFTSRGCPYKCAFCAHTVWGREITYRSASDVAEEVAYLKALGYGGIMFYDDTMMLNRRRFREICELLEPYKMVWRCFARADLVDQDMFYDMARAGCVEVLIGVESGSQAILNNIHKGTTVTQNSEAVQGARWAGIRTKALMILGLPGETEETTVETEQWIKMNRPDRLDLVTYLPFPNTPITNDPGAYDVSWDETPPEAWWYKGPREANKCLVSTSALSAERIAERRLEILESVGIPY